MVRTPHGRVAVALEEVAFLAVEAAIAAGADRFIRAVGYAAEVAVTAYKACPTVSPVATTSATGMSASL